MEGTIWYNLICYRYIKVFKWYRRELRPCLPHLEIPELLHYKYSGIWLCESLLFATLYTIKPVNTADLFKASNQANSMSDKVRYIEFLLATAAELLSPTNAHSSSSSIQYYITNIDLVITIIT